MVRKRKSGKTTVAKCRVRYRKCARVAKAVKKRATRARRKRKK